MSDIQKARDYADQKQFQADVINYNEHKHYNIEGEEADKYLIRIFEKNFPTLHAAAMDVAAKCAKEMAMAIIAGVCEINPDLLENFRRPNVQAALLSAEESFAQTGDPDTGEGDATLGLLLSRLVIKLVTNPKRSLNDIAIRRAIATAPNLTRQQIMALSVLAIFQTCSFNGSSPLELLQSMDNWYQPYYGDIPTTGIEYSYMESQGVGSVLFGPDSFDAISKKHPGALRKSFHRSAITTGIEQTDCDIYLENDPTDTEFLRVREDKANELLGSGMTDWRITLEGSNSLRNLRALVGTNFTTPAELKELAAKATPQLNEFLAALDAAGAFHFQINTIGYILAKQELDLRYPNNDLLGPMTQLDPARQPNIDNT